MNYEVFLCDECERIVEEIGLPAQEFFEDVLRAYLVDTHLYTLPLSIRRTIIGDALERRGIVVSIETDRSIFYRPLVHIREMINDGEFETFFICLDICKN